MNDAPAIPAPSAFRGVIGVATREITPPPGIYARCWGAAGHDVAEGVHAPLLLTCVTFRQRRGAPPLVLIGADLMSWRSREDEWSVRSAVLDALSLDESRLMFCLSHTHAAPSVRTDDEDNPGGHLIAAFRGQLRDAAVAAVRQAVDKAFDATLTWRYGRCDLAANRDLPEPGGSRIICGYNPEMPADDTLLVARISDADDRTVATIVNYACHPTTLAWENRLLSPDYVGATRRTVESHTGASCLFLQGASGELAPAEQYTADTDVADRHGRRLGFAVLGTLEAMDRPGTRLRYDGVVESGAPLAVWRPELMDVSTELAATRAVVPLPLKPMPSVTEIEAQWRAAGDPVQKERLWRQRAVRKVVGEDSISEMPLWAWRIGDALLVGHPNEAYSQFQRDLRRRFAPRAVAVMNLVNGSAGYLAPRALAGTDAYAVRQSPFAPGGLEQLTVAAERELAFLTGEKHHERDAT